MNRSSNVDKGRTLATLNALLARVRERASGPRRVRPAIPSASAKPAIPGVSAATAIPSASAKPAVPSVSAKPAVPSASPAAQEAEPVVLPSTELSTWEPPAPETAPKRPSLQDLFDDEPPSAQTMEIDVDEVVKVVRKSVIEGLHHAPKEVIAPAAPTESTSAVSDSSERLIAAPGSPAEVAEEYKSGVPTAESPLEPPLEGFPLHAEPPPTVTQLANEPEAGSEIEEPEERAPASSRRPVVPESEQPEERLADLAFGAQEVRPPLHTPPPESGRLPAAPDVDYDGSDITQVRGTKPELPEQPNPAVTRATLEQPEGPIAQVSGGVEPHSPATFLELLEASLALGR